MQRKMTPHDVQEKIRSTLRLTRKRLKLSQKELADKSGVPLGTIKKFEHTGNISFRQFILIYAALNDISQIVYLTSSQDIKKQPTNN
ncbi:helix-turn-helix domain-containing protein [Lelliottia wanjuensis]|uniref:helix-turn-helix domain-containing protein n=1 Tax=Lelliottia wanjuensis TaxID=3050585 RepID=UPI00254FA5C3|nr:helix-turn-helix transcriptional regulator [Lelliottia sp. V86_10]MDK9585011.1 helix-turn-helix transcriptional regulator [Lelliottia sp. V86_10]